ncbi:MAG: hypothetical protein V1789_07635 [PVC group bacterium]
MKRIAAIIFYVLVVSASPIEQQAAGEVKEFNHLSGEKLIELLQLEESQLAAFTELYRRSATKEEEYIFEILPHITDLELIVCPQSNGGLPIFLVLFKLPTDYLAQDEDSYPDDNVSRLFPPQKKEEKEGQEKERKKEMVIVGFTSTGKPIYPFGGGNMLNDGYLFDINGDGLIERVDYTSYGIQEDYDVDVLEVTAVKEDAEILLAVVYNWHESRLNEGNEWGYRINNADRDGIYEIELGPKINDGIEPKIVYRWDEAKRKYVGPQGEPGDHFRMVAPADVWNELETLKKVGGLGYIPALIPSTPKKHIHIPHAPEKLYQSYRYISLKKLSDKEVVHYMDKGKSIGDLKKEAVIITHLPKDFWNVPPKKAALEFARVNRTSDHREQFRLALNDLDDRGPPAVCSLHFSYYSDRSYVTIDAHYFLRCDPRESYLAYACTQSPGIVGYNPIHAQTCYDFRWCNLNYNEAKHIIETVWWLDRVRSERKENGDRFTSGGWSSADGLGAIEIVPDSGKNGLEYDGTIWGTTAISKRWDADYNKKIFLNLSRYLISAALPEYLGNRWALFDLKESPEKTSFRKNLCNEDMATITELSRRFLDLFSPDQRDISLKIVQVSVEAVGDFVISALSSLIPKAQQQLPPPDENENSLEELIIKHASEKIRNDGKRLARQIFSYGKGYDKKAIYLYQLRRALILAIRKLELANKPGDLAAWVLSRKEGYTWALQRLEFHYPKQYIVVLEQLLNNSNGEIARQAFEALTEVNEKKAREIAEKIPPAEKGDLTVSAFSVLEQAKAIPDEDQRVEALIEVALDPGSGWKERGKAIDCLVPADDPLRYPDQKIDNALLQLLGPKGGDDVINFTLAKACRALALRGGTKYFYIITNALNKSESGDVYQDVLSTLTYLAQSGGAKYKSQLKSILRPHLKETNQNLTEIIWHIWAADLRSLKPELERIATSSPEDYEGKKAYTSSSNITQVTERYHMARKVVSLWNEEDTVTRAKLLLAFGFDESYYMEESGNPERLNRMKIELTQLANSLSPEDLNKIESFLHWYDVEYIVKEPIPVYVERKTKFLDFARSIFNIPE